RIAAVAGADHVYAGGQGRGGQGGGRRAARERRRAQHRSAVVEGDGAVGGGRDRVTAGDGDRRGEGDALAVQRGGTGGADRDRRRHGDRHRHARDQRGNVIERVAGGREAQDGEQDVALAVHCQGRGTQPETAGIGPGEAGLAAVGFHLQHRFLRS